MAGTILQRILSRTNMASLNSNRTTDEQSPGTQQPLDHPVTRISFEEPTEHRKSSLGEISPASMYNTRKHSYASVREESGIQDFRTRRKPSSESDLPADFLPTRFESSADLVEDAIDDASDASPDSLGSAESDVDEEEKVDEEIVRPKSIEDLPEEILDQIFDILQLDVSQDSYLRPHADLFSCLLVSKALHDAALRVLYKNVVIYRSKTFHKLVTTLQDDASLGSLIKTLDFSHYSHMGYGRSRGQTNVTPYLTKENLKIVLSETTALKAFLVHEHLDDELDNGVLASLFSIPSLRAVDFTSCSSPAFVSAFTSFWLDSSPLQYSQIRRLCLHECTTLKPAVFETILPRLTRLTHLDLAHTRVNDTALLSIPSTAALTHLNLERCTQVTGAAVVYFLAEHPAAKTLLWLNLNAAYAHYRLLELDDVTELLPVLPKSLKSLNLGGARITSKHVDALRDLATHVEELGLKAAELRLSEDINKILSLPADDKTKLDKPHLRSAVRYLDLTDISSVNQFSLSHAPVSLKDPRSLPLEVIELGSTVLTELAKRSRNIRNPDWTVKELGRRGWYVRSPESLDNKGHMPDDGYRSWKMGARWWGMRKIPMANQDVGGMYGYFMFKRN